MHKYKVSLMDCNLEKKPFVRHVIYEPTQHFEFFWTISSNAVNSSFCMCFGTAVIPRWNNTWILANYDYTGFYRVNYETSMWERLAAQLNQNHTVTQSFAT